jgi:C4-type Zn-finger protein
MPQKKLCPACKEFEFSLKRRKVDEDGDTISETYACADCGYEEERMSDD